MRLSTISSLGPTPQISLRSSALPARAEAKKTGLCSSETGAVAGATTGGLAEPGRLPEGGPAGGILLRSASPAALTAGASGGLAGAGSDFGGAGGAAALAGSSDAAAALAAFLATSSSKRFRQEPITEPS